MKNIVNARTSIKHGFKNAPRKKEKSRLSRRSLSSHTNTVTMSLHTKLNVSVLLTTMASFRPGTSMVGRTTFRWMRRRGVMWGMTSSDAASTSHTMRSTAGHSTAPIIPLMTSSSTCLRWWWWIRRRRV